MGIVDPIAMTNAMATGVVDFTGGAALWLMLLGLLAGSSAGILLAAARAWQPSLRRLPRLTPAGRPRRWREPRSDSRVGSAAAHRTRHRRVPVPARPRQDRRADRRRRSRIAGRDQCQADWQRQVGPQDAEPHRARAAAAREARRARRAALRHQDRRAGGAHRRRRRRRRRPTPPATRRCCSARASAPRRRSASTPI